MNLKKFIFTFGSGQEKHQGYGIGDAVIIMAQSYAYARRIMVKKFDDKWCGQYDEGAINETELTFVNAATQDNENEDGGTWYDD